MSKLTFWLELASPYSYLSAMRIEGLAAERGIAVEWRPFLLGPIFKAQGWETSPFNVYPAKGRYMVRDMERVASERGIAFQMPKQFPANGLSAARIAIVGEGQPWQREFLRRVYLAEFGAGVDIAERAVLEAILRDLGLDSAGILASAGSPECKARLRASTTEAGEAGIFGAPTFQTTDGELFWGDDRLEQALAWALRL